MFNRSVEGAKAGSEEEKKRDPKPHREADFGPKGRIALKLVFELPGLDKKMK